MELYEDLEDIIENRFKCLNKNKIKDDIYNKKLNRLLNHSVKVKEIALEIACILKIPEEQIRLIEIASMLHDIEKYNGGEKIDNHHKIGADYVKGYLSKNCFKDLNKEDKKLICLMIRHHKGKYKNKSLNDYDILMIEIVRAADKIAKIYKKENFKVKTIIKIMNSINKLKDENVKSAAVKILLDINIQVVTIPIKITI